MKSKVFDYLLYVSTCVGLLIGLASCGQTDASRQVPQGNKYATGFALVHEDSCVRAVVYSPWEPGKVMAEYTITKPLERVGTSSCTQVGFLDALQATEHIAAVCNKERVYTPLKVDVVDLGEAMQPNKEQLLASDLEALFLSTYSNGDVVPAQLERLGVRFVYENEWMEQSPLGRAEWIRFVGAFMGREREADSIFCAVEQAYWALVKERESGGCEVMVGSPFGGTWYVPSGSTYMGRLIDNSGARYAFLSDKHMESVPLTFEEAWARFGKSDVWVGCSAATLDELMQWDERYAWFESVKSGNVYNWLAQSTERGANNFWERGAVHPEEILEDLLQITQPKNNAGGKNSDSLSLHYAKNIVFLSK